MPAGSERQTGRPLSQNQVFLSLLGELQGSTLEGKANDQSLLSQAVATGAWWESCAVSHAAPSPSLSASGIRAVWGVGREWECTLTTVAGSFSAFALAVAAGNPNDVSYTATQSEWQRPPTATRYAQRRPYASCFASSVAADINNIMRRVQLTLYGSPCRV